MIEIKENIFWVGIKDWEIKTFHGEELSTHRGSTYNSYLIKDEKNVLVDTVWTPFKEEYVARLDAEFGLDNIDAVVVNHSESDHSGSLTHLMSQIPDADIYCTKNGHDMIYRHHHMDWKFNEVKTGDTLKTGKYELVFVEAPMLHWPDSMFTYVKGADLLLSNDAFGQHYATSAMYDDEVDQCELFQEAIKYYANILTPFSSLVKKKIEEFKAMNVPVDMIAPSHGVIWRKDALDIVGKYYEWADAYQEDFVVIAYDTMWNGTKSMAEAIASGLKESRVPYKLFNIAKSDMNDIITQIFRSKGVIVGSPTINRRVLSAVSALIETMKGLRFKNKAGAAFGGYGWSGESVSVIEDGLKSAGIEVAVPGIKFRYNPTSDELEECKQFGKQFAKNLKK
ncbi:MAG: flavoprotein A [Candidatus Methanoperedens nitroreducens]|uniref:Flavoprotein A n=1 Tax=Candidatus Methanoperedens nitratireducens TaxID=1392998 RepID=A0A0P8CBN8_9EURY|nr:flavodoxin domain-containing protein [Candidatus Methanoperedens sp. BLZ2]KAB2946976.1 MAG: MBL fold metallo-hydrolase [Candidatus Methanoperedens sp.]KPQ44264.1 MAG: flavoprotein A [Candidatus Methanoperedens sp. BLZ1]MBZ0176778.1 flavodoxin domain-containing protein [Candidatus Methanoperedens nitroreducens]MCX9080500.1 flavodoxin domain-containing protein [Candidatus Methanoperedens sp.]